MKLSAKAFPVAALALALSFVRVSAQSDTHPDVPVVQPYEMLVYDADEMHHFYDFNAAIEYYNEALAACTDSLKRLEIERKIALSTNGRNLSAFCSKPKVVARKNFALADFFLYYPLEDKSWHPTPNRLDAFGGPLAMAVYAPDGAQELIWSGRDSLGVRNIMTKRPGDSLAVKAPFSSPSDEIYPLVSGDRLYFSSKGLYGVGGYDLYCCRRLPDGSWSTPENMGFPYSSPEDDFLFMNTGNGKYSIFASNRDCTKDSVTVYVLKQEVMPVRSAVTDIDELQALCSLTPQDDLKKVDNKAISSRPAPDASTKVYMDKVSEVRAIRDELDAMNRKLISLRTAYATATEAEKALRANEISQLEQTINKTQVRFNQANKDLQRTEMDFLLHGVLIDRSKAEEEASAEVVVEKAYTFSKKNIGSADLP